MVERPIKKSERQQVAPPADAVEGLETDAVEGLETSTFEENSEPSPSAPKKGKIVLPTRRQDKPEGADEGEGKGSGDSRSEGRGKGRGEGRSDGRGEGRGDGRGEGRKQREEGRDRPGGVSMALMRGPKPSKAKPPVVVAQAEPETDEEAASDAGQNVEQAEAEQVAVES